MPRPSAEIELEDRTERDGVPGGESDVSIDRVCRCLSERRRRVILGLLAESESEGVRELARRLGEADGWGSPQDDGRGRGSSNGATLASSVETDEVKPPLETIQIELAHVHLPMLEDAGIVRFDEQVVRGPAFDLALEFLERGTGLTA